MVFVVDKNDELVVSGRGRGENGDVGESIPQELVRDDRIGIDRCTGVDDRISDRELDVLVDRNSAVIIIIRNREIALIGGLEHPGGHPGWLSREAIGRRDRRGDQSERAVSHSLVNLDRSRAIENGEVGITAIGE